MKVEARGDCWLIAICLGSTVRSYTSALAATRFGGLDSVRRASLTLDRIRVVDALSNVGDIFSTDEELEEWASCYWVLGPHEDAPQLSKRRTR